MPLFEIHIHEHPDAVNVELQRRVETMLGDCLKRIEEMSLNTQAALDGVRQLTTDNASLRKLLETIKSNLDDVKSQLATAITNGDPAAIAAAQADLDTITQLANTEDQAVKAALGANVSGGGDGAGGASGGTATA